MTGLDTSLSPFIGHGGLCAGIRQQLPTILGFLCAPRQQAQGDEVLGCLLLVQIVIERMRLEASQLHGTMTPSLCGLAASQSKEPTDDDQTPCHDGGAGRA